MKSPLLTVMSNAAVAAGRGLLRDFGEADQLQVSKKGAGDFVTASDVRTEKKLVAELRRARPDFGFFAEEEGEIPGKSEEFRWLIDPIDGTSNFIHAAPYFCISIALERLVKKGVRETVAGVIYDPIHNELFAAEKGKGAFLNDRRMSASAREKMEDAMLVTSSTHSLLKDAETTPGLRQLFDAAGLLRATGAAALDLAYLAAGRYDICWFKGLKPWDSAAGLLLLSEAGGMASDGANGAATPYSATLLAANKPLFPKAMKLLAASPLNR